MTKSKITILLLGTILLMLTAMSGCHRQPKTITVKYEAKSRIYPLNDSANSPKDTVYSGILISTTIGGKPFKLIFDTGANSTGLFYTPQLKKELEISHLTGVVTNISTALAKTFDTIYFADLDLSIGDLCWKNKPIFLDGYKRSSIYRLNYADGILGTDIICSKNWLFDLKAQTVTISEEDIDENMIDSPLALAMDMVQNDSSHILLNVQVNDSLSVPFLFDSAYTTSLRMNQEDIGKKYLLPTTLCIADSLKEFVSPIDSIGKYIIITDKLIFNQLEMDTLHILRTKYWGCAIEELHSMQNFIGDGFIQNFRYMLIDYKKRQVRFYGYSPHNKDIKRYIKDMQQKKKKEK